MTWFTWDNATVTYTTKGTTAPIVANVKAFEPPRCLPGASVVPASVTFEALGTFEDGPRVGTILANLYGDDRLPQYDARSTFADGREMLRRVAVEEGAAGSYWLTPFHGPRRRDGSW